jgi:hypothetical protein
VSYPGHDHPIPLQQCPRRVEERFVIIDYYASQLHFPIFSADDIARIAAGRSRGVNAHP